MKFTTGLCVLMSLAWFTNAFFNTEPISPLAIRGTLGAIYLLLAVISYDNRV